MEVSLPVRMSEAGRRIDSELVETLDAMLQDRQAITARAVARRMHSITQPSTLTRDAWRALRLAESRAEQQALERTAETRGNCESDPRPPFRGLEYFLCLARVGNFGRASRQLGVDQPVLTRHVQNLESGLGAQLFVRHGRGVTLTAAGISLAACLAARQETAERVEGWHMDREPVSLGLPPEAGPIIVPPMIAYLRQHHSAIALTVKEGASATLEEWLLNGQINVALLPNSPRFDDIVLEPVFTEGVGLITSPSLGYSPVNVRIGLTELSNVPLIMPSERHWIRRAFLDLSHRRGMRTTLVAEVDDVPTAIAMVRAGVGSAIMPQAAVTEDVDRGRLCFTPIEHPLLAARYAIATSRVPHSSSTSALMNAVRDVVVPAVRNGRWPGATLVARRMEPVPSPASNGPQVSFACDLELSGYA